MIKEGGYPAQWRLLGDEVSQCFEENAARKKKRLVRSIAWII
jgi:hypothetical protein